MTTIDTDLVQNIFVTAIDSSGNITKNKKVGTIIGINKGRVFIDNEDIDEFISKVSIYIYKFDDATGQYNKFAPSIDGIPVDIETDTNGQYELVLPAGDYTISAVKSGFKVIKKEFSVPTAQIISDPFITKKIRGAEKIIADILNRWSY